MIEIKSCFQIQIFKGTQTVMLPFGFTIPHIASRSSCTTITFSLLVCLFLLESRVFFVFFFCLDHKLVILCVHVKPAFWDVLSWIKYAIRHSNCARQIWNFNFVEANPIGESGNWNLFFKECYQYQKKSKVRHILNLPMGGCLTS